MQSNKVRDEKTKKILVFRIGHLGDTLVALPAFWQLRNNFPNADITLLNNVDVNNPHYISASSVLPKNGLFNNYMEYPTGVSGIRKFYELAQLLKKIRKSKFDLFIYMMTRNRTKDQINRDESYFRLTRIKDLKGFNYLRENGLNNNADYNLTPIVSEHQFLKDLIYDEGLINTLQYESDEITELLLTVDEITNSSKIVGELASDIKILDKCVIAVAPGSKWDSKKWDTAKFIATLKKLNDHINIYPLIFGGKEDKSVGDHITSELGFGTNLSGALSVRESAAALSKCKLYIGNDTGTMHLAASVGVTCVAIFAAIDYIGRWNPIGSHHKIIRKQVECAGCHSPVCLTDRRCLEQIEIDEVFQSSIEILNIKRSS